MPTYARIQNGTVAELFTPPDGVPLADCFVAAVAQSFVPVPGGVEPAQGWTFDGMTFAAPVIPTPPAETPDQVLAAKIAAGIGITCTSNPALSATFALDDVTMNQVGPVARDFASGFGLPGGTGTFTYPDATGQPRTFTGPQVVALYRAQRDLLFALNTAAAMLAHGAPESWPASQAATIA